MSALSDTYLHAVLSRELGGSGWEFSEPLGTMAKTRLARRPGGGGAVAVKLVETPPEVMTRLSELGVTPPVLGTGEYAGSRYLIQRAVDGPHPDHAWFAANADSWADLVRAYLADARLRELVAAGPAFWRLTVADAVTQTDTTGLRSRALGEAAFRSCLERWCQQAESIVGHPLRPIHPDPHWHNYVIVNGRPYLLDWEHIDLSDSIRDVGIQVWGFLRRPRWAPFLRRVGITPTDDVERAIYWWAAFKMLSNAIFNDHRGHEQGAAFHAAGFRVAVERRPWLDE